MDKTMRLLCHFLVAFALVVILGSRILPATAQGIPAPAGSETKPLSEIIAALEQQGFRDFDEVETENGYYEIKLRDRDGRPVELHVDRTTGQILRQEAR